MPVKSVSLDNGAEFSGFRKLKESLSTLVYFAEPHKPWQRGTNENIQVVEDLINNRPRKCLDWKTPAEILAECVALG